ncbi:MAG: lysine--tRNA ligase [archaeon]
MENIRGREKQIVEERIKKINELRKDGIEPYAYSFDKNRNYSEDIKKKYLKLGDGEFGKEVVIAGRVMTKRSLGMISFAKLQDLKGDIQLVFQKGMTSEDIFNLFKRVDSGDIVGVHGKVFRTKRGELSIMVESLKILTKAILPLPEKFHGLKDDEEKLRKRYLDIIMNPEVKNLFILKQKFWATIRSFLVDEGFLEVETPILESSAGGATAEPFVTHHNALDLDVYLRISMGELWQKKLLVAGYEKTFEIGRQFRNEGMDMEHLQDYSQMEFYWGYADFSDGMKLVEKMYKKVAKEVLGTLKFKTHGYEIDLSRKWEIYDYEKFIEEKTGIKIFEDGMEKIMKSLGEFGMEYDSSVDKWRLVDILWKYCRKQISGPGFLVGQPVEIAPLAKRSRKDSRKVEQFQVIIAGTEMGNGYSELNDPIDQEGRFIRQAKLKEAGDLEAQEHDKEFVEALMYGMPPACGFGVSERLFSYLVDRPIKECVMFPLMKPECSVQKKVKKRKQ